VGVDGYDSHRLCQLVDCLSQRLVLGKATPSLFGR
jgi:hypothetical protein